MFEFLNRVRGLGYVFLLSSLPPANNPCSRADVTLDIPAIAVIGWQSAGKSSLIEAISGITLPRASGTCTRLVPQTHRLLAILPRGVTT
jgi:50S ribosomal subunit-associated GTPase HflX